jgi:uncharacterized protein YkwD
MFIVNWINKWRLAKQINDVRASNGLNSLTRDRSLDNVAWQHAMYMAKNSRLGYDGFENRAAIIRWQSKRSDRKYVGENCGKHTGSSLDVNVIRATMDGWMKSDSHRNAIMNPVYNRTGIAGVVEQGHVYVVQVFAGEGVKVRRLPAVSATPAFSE